MVPQKNDNDSLDKATSLRRRADEIARGKDTLSVENIEGMRPGEIQQIIHELKSDPNIEPKSLKRLLDFFPGLGKNRTACTRGRHKDGRLGSYNLHVLFFVRIPVIRMS